MRCERGLEGVEKERRVVMKARRSAEEDRVDSVWRYLSSSASSEAVGSEARARDAMQLKEELDCSSLHFLPLPPNTPPQTNMYALVRRTLACLTLHPPTSLFLCR